MRSDVRKEELTTLKSVKKRVVIATALVMKVSSQLKMEATQAPKVMGSYLRGKAM
jgi:hypothetical protein